MSGMFSLCPDCCDCPPTGEGSIFSLVMSAAEMGTIDPTSGAEIDLGSFPRGYYQMQYCGGAYQTNLDFPSQNQWCAGAKDCGGFFFTPGCEAYFVEYNSLAGDSGTTITVGMPSPNQPPLGPFTYAAFDTQADAETAFKGMFGSFTHDGTDPGGTMGDHIFFGLTDPDFTDNAHGSPDPTFNLYRIFPKFIFKTFSATRISSTSCSCDFTITNPTGSFTWTPMVESLDDYGGITGSDTASADISQNADTTFTLTFTAAIGADVTARLRLACKYFGDSPGADVIFFVHLGVF